MDNQESSLSEELGLIKMQITNEIIEEAEFQKACRNGIEWGLSVIAKELNKENVIIPCFLWALKNTSLKNQNIDMDLINWCIEKEPDFVLKYISNIITKEQLDYCAEKYPCSALEWASHLLTPERLDRCAEKMPGYALVYKSNRLLTKERFDWCVEQDPYHALEYAEELLTSEQLSYCKQQQEILPAVF